MSGTVRFDEHSLVEPTDADDDEDTQTRPGGGRSEAHLGGDQGRHHGAVHRAARLLRLPLRRQGACAAARAIACGASSTTPPASSTSRACRSPASTSGEITDRRAARARSRASPSASSPRRSCGRTRPCSRSRRRCSASSTWRSIRARAESPDPMTGKMQQEPPAAGRRSDPERRRGGDDLRHPGAGERDAAGAARHPAATCSKLTQGPLQDIAKSVQTGVDKNSAAAEQLLHHIDSIALDISGMTGGPRRRRRQEVDLENIREITESIKGAGGHRAAPRWARRATSSVRTSTRSARHRQPEPHAREHGVGDRQGERAARAPSGACSTTTPSRRTSSRSPRTRAASSAR